jgi:hypothetical protein
VAQRPGTLLASVGAARGGLPLGRCAISFLLCFVAYSTLLPTPTVISCGDDWLAPPLAEVQPDVHVYRFPAQRGMHVVFETFQDDSWPRPVNTQVELFNADSGELIAQNNNKAFGDLYSRLFACIPVDGFYEAKVSAAPGSIGGAYAAKLSCESPQLHHDDCAQAGLFTCGPLSYENLTRCLTNDFDPGSEGCTGYPTTGGDAVLGIVVEAGSRLAVTMSSSADAALYLVGDCHDVMGSCVAGVDANLAGESETLNYTFDKPGVWYLVLDHHGGGQGTLRLSGNLDCATVSVQPRTWTQVRRLYRE